MHELTEDLRNFKDLDEWTDEDNKRRYSRSKIITKKDIAKILEDYAGETPNVKKLRVKY